ncbi:MAG: hypothetical protein COA58_11440 [Bacteroidetes bacterium]|nr:MAG: hypothetical protein COA58_11440 [Bacteroidota bacterium]
MNLKTLLTIILSLTLGFTYAQNEKTNREEFVLKLPVDGEQFYEQQVDKSPYFVKENVLQIYPGEKVFVEVELKKKEITSMKVVEKNLNPEKTIEIEFTQNTKDRKSESMMLKIVNPFKKDLEYKAMMFIVGHNQWIDTTVLPVKSKLTGYESWTDIIITIALSDWKLK